MRRINVLVLGTLLAAGCENVGRSIPTFPGLAPAPAKTTYSWQQPQTRVLRTGDLEWQPAPFAFARGAAVRYIDYASGQDANPGTAPQKPWKHHPWDPMATDAAARCGDDVDTFIFKGGVTYRGQLQARRSGTAKTPLRLSCDPAWGSGRAVICPARPSTPAIPAASAIEPAPPPLIPLADTFTALDIRSQSHIQISNLAFCAMDAQSADRAIGSRGADELCTIRVEGKCADIAVTHCSFADLPLPLYATPQRRESRLAGLRFSDNRVDRAGLWAVMAFAPGELSDVGVLRNLIRDSGAGAISVRGAVSAEIAGNIIERSGGPGILVDASGAENPPLQRVLIHHNKVVEAALKTGDAGGIATRRGGTFYLFDNLCGNTGGGKSLYPADTYSFEGPANIVAFNNIAWGSSLGEGSVTVPAAGISRTYNPRTLLACNTLYRLGAGVSSQGAALPQLTCLGNIFSEIRYGYFLDKGPSARAASLGASAYLGNVFYGRPRVFGELAAGDEPYPAFAEFQKALADGQAVASELGAICNDSPLQNPAGGDYRPTAAAAASILLAPATKPLGTPPPPSLIRARGPRIFVPWPLAATVGEWNFQYHPANPNFIPDESDYPHRYALIGNSFLPDSYFVGPLEDWVPGALRLNGVDQYLKLEDALIRADLPRPDRQPALPPWRFSSVDMDTNSFTIEAHLRVDPTSLGGAIVSKMGDSGYELRVTDDAGVMLMLKSPLEISSVGQSGIFSDGKWHHLLVEVDRRQSKATLFVDGKFVSSGSPITRGSLANRSDFRVGMDSDGRYLAAEIEYLRITRSTLAESGTSIEELYAWQFSGPQHRDFTDHRPDEDQSRPPGAIQK